MHHHLAAAAGLEPSLRASSAVRAARFIVGVVRCVAHDKSSYIARRMEASAPPESGDDSRTRARTAPDAVLAMMRPELFPFLSASSLGALSTCAATVRGALLEGGAWRMLAQSRDVALLSPARALELDAIARLKSQQRRRWLATHFTDQQPVMTKATPMARPDAGFTYFVRVVDGGRMLWEGDVKGALKDRGQFISLDLSRFWSDVSESWDAMRDFLSVLMDDGADQNPRVFRRLEFYVVAVRDNDQAMFFMGRFKFDECIGTYTDPAQYYIFEADGRNTQLHSCCEGEETTKFSAVLTTTHNPAGGGTVDWLDLMTSLNSKRAVVQPYDPNGFIADLAASELTIVFNELANQVHYTLDEDCEYARTGAVVPYPLLTTWAEKIDPHSLGLPIP